MTVPRTYGRMRIVVRGVVQGVGFRPTVYLIARELGLTGWVSNSAQGATIEVEGDPERMNALLMRLSTDLPPPACIHNMEPTTLEPAGYTSFTIRESTDTGAKRALVLPDLATCPDCLRELLDPADRRYLYPFLNCTHCGPRYTILNSLPYDRANTTMSSFVLCPACREEYEDPRNRRFHAQPTACPDCGPQLALLDAGGRPIATRHEALLTTAEAIRAGCIVAIKGIGGFHLVCDACNSDAVLTLRARKHREAKPFAIMAPNVPWIETVCRISDLERRLLRSAEAPIVLLARMSPADGLISSEVAPNLPSLGVMLPYAPLHHLLVRELGFPIIATSGNLRDEPICTDNDDALTRLAGIADLFLMHDRTIARPVDDSLIRVLVGREMMVRRARGYAPLPLQMPAASAPMLAVGAHLKNTIGIAFGGNAFLSQHVGDLETLQATRLFQNEISDLCGIYEVKPELIISDRHPDYFSTQFAEELAGRFNVPLYQVQHHHAHVLACCTENEVMGIVTGYAWDGVGYSDDGTVWGGETLTVEGVDYRRAGALRSFRLPGGDAAAREPRRSAAGILFSLKHEVDFPEAASWFRDGEHYALQQMLERGFNSPLTTSAGRLFDAVSCITGLRTISNYEGQAAVELEAVGKAHLPSWSGNAYVMPIVAAPDEPCVLDWGPMFKAAIADVKSGITVGEISCRFHSCLADAITQSAIVIGNETVALTGGCFQNGLLLTLTVERLQRAGLRPIWHQRVPPGDGSISLGQLAAGAALMKRKEEN